MKKVFVDSGAWYALIDKKDPDHPAVVEALSAYDGRLVTSNFVADESLTLLRSKCGFENACDFGNVLFSGRLAEVVRITEEDEIEAWRMFRKYDDKVLSFTDCTSFVLMRRLNIDTAISLDADFRRVGFQSLPA